MSTKQLAELIGKRIRIQDTRTGVGYHTLIVDSKNVFGNLRIQVETSSVWFQPTHSELQSVSSHD